MTNFFCFLFSKGRFLFVTWVKLSTLFISRLNNHLQEMSVPIIISLQEEIDCKKNLMLTIEKCILFNSDHLILYSKHKKLKKFIITKQLKFANYFHFV